MKDMEKLAKLVMEANEAKDRLARLAKKLEEEGFHRKASSLMTLVCKIEDWQNK